jgi:hypothetical protein
VVRHDDAVDPVLDGDRRVARALDPLSRIGPSQFARISGSCDQLRPGFWKTPAKATAGRQPGDLAGTGMAAPEDRVARVVRDALVLEEGRVPAVQVERPPAEQRRVERDDQVGVAGRLGTAQEGRDSSSSVGQ